MKRVNRVSKYVNERRSGNIFPSYISKAEDVLDLNYTYNTRENIVNFPVCLWWIVMIGYKSKFQPVNRNDLVKSVFFLFIES